MFGTIFLFLFLNSGFAGYAFCSDEFFDWYGSFPMSFFSYFFVESLSFDTILFNALLTLFCFFLCCYTVLFLSVFLYFCLS